MDNIIADIALDQEAEIKITAKGQTQIFKVFVELPSDEDINKLRDIKDNKLLIEIFNRNISFINDEDKITFDGICKKRNAIRMHTFIQLVNQMAEQKPKKSDK